MDTSIIGILIGLAILIVLTANLIFMIYIGKYLLRLIAMYTEDRQYLAAVYQQIVETNEMLASTENNSFIIASKAVTEQED